MSNRLTFSLASLVFLIALGLVFAPTSVLAHSEDGQNPLVGNNDPADHTHDGMKPIDGVDSNDDGDFDDVGDVPAHNSHPTATIALEAGDTVRGTKAVVTTTAATFTLEIDFDQVVAENSNTTKPSTGLPTNPLAADGTDFTFDVLNVASTPAIVSGAVDSVDVTRGTTGKKFTAVVTMNTTNGIPSGTADEDDETLTFRIFLKQNSVYSYQTTVTSPIPGQNPTYGGGANAQSTVYTFKLVKTLPDVPTLSFGTLAEPADAVTTGSFDITYTTTPATGVSVDSEITRVSPLGAADHYSLNTSAAGTVTVNQAMPSATLTTVPAATVTVTLTPSSTDSGTGTAQTFSVSFTEATFTQPNRAPTATISTTAPASGQTGSFDITYTTADADEEDTVTVTVARTTSPTDALDHYTVADSTSGGTVTITQAMPSATLTTVPAATVTVSITPNDGTVDGTAATIAVPFAVRTYTPPSAIGAGEYAVFVPKDHDTGAFPGGLMTHKVDMPDLGAFFVSGGTIDVSVTGTGRAEHDVIITEIMVAKDLGRAGQTDTMRPEAGQWIELYNNTTTAINVSDITIAFTKGDPAPTMLAGVTDRLSNTVGAGWGFEAAFKDALSGQTATSASNVVTVTKTFKSLRRSYKKNANDYDDTKKLQDDGTVIGDGWDQRSWKLTVDSRLFLAGRVGTPGSENRPTVFTPETFTAPSMSVRFNEIANRSDNTNEWIELAGAKDTNLKKHKISIVEGYNKATNKGTENTIYEFPNADVKIPGDGILLLTDQNPTSNELAADIEKGVAKPKRYRVVTLADLPNEGNFLLVLRDGGGKILDVAGHLPGLDDDKPYTQLWPLKGKVGNISDKNKLASGKVYRRARAIQGYSSNKVNGNEPAFEVVGFTGIGYDRIAPETAENGGTPGYPNNIAKNYEQQGTGTVATPVIISEIMYATGDRANMPQWIELYNTSKTEAINLSGWRVTILNHDKDNGDGMGDITYAGDLSKNYDLSGNIPPNQTFLLVAYQGRNDTKLLSKRIQLLRANRGELLLSQYGFEITLYPKAKDNKDANRKVTDQAGNLGTVEDALVRRNPRSYIDPAWELPAGTNEEGARVSIVRGWAKGTKVGLVTHRSSDINNVLPGTMKPAWSTFDMSGQLVRTLDKTYYGHSTDIGSPGHTVGGALPVSLSKFRPERLDDGSIVVRWITESELNNAGFNILRSDTRDGQFTKLNEQMIKGQGTTSERTVYDFVDKTAKPNVVYYYQIQDVSLDGDVVTLRTSRLKGHISAAGKATTTWAELKALQ